MKNSLCNLKRPWFAFNKTKKLFSSEFGISLDQGVLLQEIAECSSTASTLVYKYSMTRQVMDHILLGLEDLGLITEDTTRENKYYARTRYLIVTEKGKSVLKSIHESDILPLFVLHEHEDSGDHAE